jgi:teichuronic acid biosynthesis protein TuaE
MSETAGSGPVTPSHARSALADAGVILVGAVATVIAAAGLTRRPSEGLALLALAAIVATIALNRKRIARLRINRLLAAGLVALPAAALLGPAFALPSQPQLFLFRILLAVIALVGVTYLVVVRDPLPFAAKDVALPIVLWFAWLFIGLLWAGDRASALDYIAIVVTMMAALLATASAGGSGRRLLWLGYLLTLAYVFIAGFALIEARLGIHLGISKLSNLAGTQLTGSQSYAVTSVFVNQNDLATYLAFCWPFMLCAFFFTRRRLWLVLDVLFILAGAATFLRTGSRTSLLAAGISTAGAVVLFARLGPRLSTPRGKVTVAVVACLLVVAGSYLLFNGSQTGMLGQFRLATLIQQAQSGSGSGEIRTSLTSQALQIVGHSLLLGVGPGQAEHIISQGVGALGISNLHDWWLESYADGGLVGFALQAGFYVLLIAALWPVARRDPDPYLRYLASGTFLALIGFSIGALGPSSSVGFAPMWVLYGLGLAVVSRARLAGKAGPAA